jgi:hypothetical protein
LLPNLGLVIKEIHIYTMIKSRLVNTIVGAKLPFRLGT